MKRAVSLLILLIGLGSSAAQQTVTSPEAAFGFKPGTDRKLADWKELTAYFKKLSTESDRIRSEEIGKTTEGRPFIAVTISSADNIAHLDKYKQIQARLADPRITTEEQAKELITQGKTVLVVTCNIHSTEIASSQSATEFAYRLATGNTLEIQSILNNVIIVLVPSLNPDGQQLVVDWYKKYLGTPYEGTNPVVLWAHYTGHDDNRDWSSFTQIETRLAVEKVINPWHPQILYDIHQMGSNGPRIYLPPWVDPIDPNVDPLLVSSMNALGTNTALDIAATGKQGVLVHGVYDFWSPLRDYIALHNGLRVLTESASVNIASPIDIPFERLDRGIGYDAKVAAWNFPDPWKGGHWTLGDIVAYQIDAFFSIASNAATYRERYLSNYYKIGEHAVHSKSGPYAYIIPAEQTDSATTTRLINTLRIADNEVEQATADFDVDGKHYTSGSYIVHLAQPYGAFAKTVLEIQKYPNIPEYPGGPLQRPYDVTAQTLPLLFGVTATPVEKEFSVPSRKVEVATVTPGRFEKTANAKGYLIDDETNSSLYALFVLLKDGVRAYRLTGPGTSPGTIYIPRQKGLDERLAALAEKFPIKIRPATSAPTGTALSVRLPRIALYQSWVASMDEGWTRWIFDQNNIPYTRVVDADIRKGDLDKRFDVIVLPDNAPRAITTGRFGGGEGAAPEPQAARAARRNGNLQSTATSETERGPQIPPEFRGGLGEAGIAGLKAFAEAGGTIVTLNRASQVYATKNPGAVTNALEGITNKDFYIPGSILEVTVDPSNPIAFGSTPTVPVFFELSPSFNLTNDARPVATYTRDNPLLSGWVLGGKYLKGTAAIAEEPVGKGRIVLFGFRPQYRAQSEVTYKFLFNSLLYSSSKSVSLAEVAGRKGGD
ncbi:M14 family metallopeptidase [Terriglobus saanensis]|uniref:Peptidase M14 carboxypeptidase A n=1 Tax=Terriglobus saanensis (strain ATCC BAA-1853 / DSM 23119 / SP1PR4) TaxID=401053 RepID=E8UX93_TERSS|nr:M14 family metallopeptidase [Terriglobus saanensis]ADV83056.1 peptidase M14 carboxypeptidase A [Terriglobus saanensis SP1PR4]